MTCRFREAIVGVGSESREYLNSIPISSRVYLADLGRMRKTLTNRKRSDEDLRYLSMTLRAVSPESSNDRIRAASRAALNALTGNEHRDDPEIQSQADVARFLRCSRWTVRRLARTGKLRPIRIGGLIRFRKSDIEALLASGATNGAK